MVGRLEPLVDVHYSWNRHQKISWMFPFQLWVSGRKIHHFQPLETPTTTLIRPRSSSGCFFQVLASRNFSKVPKRTLKNLGRYGLGRFVASRRVDHAKPTPMLFHENCRVAEPFRVPLSTNNCVEVSFFSCCIRKTLGSMFRLLEGSSRHQRRQGDSKWFWVLTPCWNSDEVIESYWISWKG